MEKMSRTGTTVMIGRMIYMFRRGTTVGIWTYGKHVDKGDDGW